MTDKEFYTRLIEFPCEGCSAYEEIGHCGLWGSNCIIPSLLTKLREELLPFLGWTADIFLDYIFYIENEELNFLAECEEIDCYVDDECWEDERFLYI